ncbi:MAG: FlxA-like family protein, partial [Lachnospiraceae bacterium]|nr:FlxA-like family protein [Lachnospiraceae bacterium]
MTIGNGNGNGAANNVQSVRANTNMQSDSVSKGIQDQIANAQKQLQELGANKDMTPEEKMKKRQEIQQEINNLNQQLRQHQIEKRKEQQARNTPEQKRAAT